MPARYHSHGTRVSKRALEKPYLGTVILRSPYVMPGTDLGYAATKVYRGLGSTGREPAPVASYVRSYAMSGTDLAIPVPGG